MKKFKFYLMAALMMAVASLSFAKVEEMIGAKDANSSRRKFMAEACTDDVALEYLDNVLKSERISGKLKDFYSVTNDSAVKEDERMVSTVTKDIYKNFKVRNNDSFSYVVFRNAPDDDIDGCDGWVVFAHYAKNDSSQWYYYIWYFDLVD